MQHPIKTKKVMKMKNVSAWFFAVGSTAGEVGKTEAKNKKVYGADGNRILCCLAFFSTFYLVA